MTIGNIITTLNKPSSVLPVVMLESTVTTGRYIQGYKNRGRDAAAEAARECAVSATVWIGGFRGLNAIGNLIGKHALKLPEVKYDLKGDALRTPLENLAKTFKNVNPSKFKAFKAAQIGISIALATFGTGYVVPKTNQAITNHSRAKRAKLEQSQQQNNNNNNNVKKQSMGAGLETFVKCANSIDKNPITNMFITQTGTIGGRIATARNNRDRIEYLYRDTLSTYFYLFAMKHIKTGLQKFAPMGTMAKIDPNCAKIVNDMLTDSLGDKKEMSVKDFKKLLKGEISADNKNILNNLKFENDVISLNNLKASEGVTHDIAERAAKMAELQPEHAAKGQVLTKRQVIDVFSGGTSNQGEFLKNIYGEKFGKDLTNKFKFIDKSSIDNFRTDIDCYIDSVTNFAEKNNNGKITKNIIDKARKLNVAKTGGYWLTAFAVSSAFLSTIIPKTQYMVSRAINKNHKFEIPPEQSL